MPFPITVGEHTWADGPALLAAVLADARAGGGTVIDDAPPSTWVADLVEQGVLEHALAVGLVAAVLQQASEASAVAEAARLAARLDHPDLGELLLTSLDAFDTGLLLTADPLAPGRSVEDALLEGAYLLTDLSDDETRADLLPRLRNAGLTGMECRALAAHGSPDEIRTWLPAVLIEGLPEGAAAALAAGLRRGGDVTEALIEVCEATDPALRRAVLDAIEARDDRRELREVVARLVPREAGQA